MRGPCSIGEGEAPRLEGGGGSRRALLADRAQMQDWGEKLPRSFRFQEKDVILKIEDKDDWSLRFPLLKAYLGELHSGIECAVARAAISSQACPGRMVPMQSSLLCHPRTTTWCGDFLPRVRGTRPWLPLFRIFPYSPLAL